MTAISGIKITALQDIGASNISYTTLVPVVKLGNSTTTITEKANLQIVGNLILNSAGGFYFPPAAVAVLAQSVSNAAQPNITSVGTLTSLTLSGNLNATNIILIGQISASTQTGISANGTNQSTATLITSAINVIGTASAGQGVILPAVSGATITLVNSTVNSVLVYPNLGGAINSSYSNVPLTLNPSVILQFISSSTTQWYTIGGDGSLPIPTSSTTTTTTSGPTTTSTTTRGPTTTTTTTTAAPTSTTTTTSGPTTTSTTTRGPTTTTTTTTAAPTSTTTTTSGPTTTSTTTLGPTTTTTTTTAAPTSTTTTTSGPTTTSTTTLGPTTTSTTTVGPPTYSVGDPPGDQVNEGTAWDFFITTTNVPAGTTIYWTIDYNSSSSPSDFNVNSGSLVLSSDPNANQFTLGFLYDPLSTGPKTFILQIRTGSLSGPVVTTSNVITILDVTTTTTTTAGP
jgi:hypothetical protein